MTRMLLVSVVLVMTILLIVEQEQPLRETEAQDECEYYSLDDRGKGGTLKDCRGEMSYILPSGDVCDLNQDAVIVYGCVNGEERELVNLPHRQEEVTSHNRTIPLLSCKQNSS
jgi:hypothetical protein